MKTLLITFAVCLVVQASSQHIELVAELVASSSTVLQPDLAGYPAEGARTYRLYVQVFGEQEIFVTGVFAESGFDLELGADNGKIWNPEWGETVADDVNTGFFEFFPGTEWDSYLTIGRTPEQTSGGTTFYSSTFPSSTTIDDAFQANVSEQNLLLEQGFWHATSLESGTPQGASNRVLLAQVTTMDEGNLVAKLNIECLVDGAPKKFVWGTGSNVDDQEDITPTCCLILPAPNDGCDCWPVAGCTDPLACNYSPEFLFDNGTCHYPACGNASACNYSPTAWCVDETLCTFPGCLDETALNYDPDAACEGSCVFSCVDVGEISGDGVVNTTDLLMIVAEYGCTDSCLSDLDGSGTVGVADILTVLGNLGMTCL